MIYSRFLLGDIQPFASCDFHRQAGARVAKRRAALSRWSRTRRVCFGGMRSDGKKDGSDPILTRRHFAERLDGTGKM